MRAVFAGGPDKHFLTSCLLKSGMEADERITDLRIEELNEISISRPLVRACEAFLLAEKARDAFTSSGFFDRVLYAMGLKRIGGKTLDKINEEFLKAVEGLTPEERKHIENVADAYAAKWAKLRQRTGGVGGIASSMIDLYYGLAAGSRRKEFIQEMFPSLKKPERKAPQPLKTPPEKPKKAPEPRERRGEAVRPV